MNLSIDRVPQYWDLDELEPDSFHIKLVVYEHGKNYGPVLEHIHCCPEKLWEGQHPMLLVNGDFKSSTGRFYLVKAQFLIQEQTKKS